MWNLTALQTTEAVEGLTFKDSMTVSQVRNAIGREHTDRNVRATLKSMTDEGLLVERAGGRGNQLSYIRDTEWPEVKRAADGAGR